MLTYLRFLFCHMNVTDFKLLSRLSFSRRKPLKDVSLLTRSRKIPRITEILVVILHVFAVILPKDVCKANMGYLLSLYPPHTKYGGYTVFRLSIIRSCRDFGFCFRSISWEKIDGVWPNFAYALILTIVTRQFLQTYNRVMSLDWCWNFIAAQYLENKFVEFNQILQMNWYWQGLGWDCYGSIFAKL